MTTNEPHAAERATPDVQVTREQHYAAQAELQRADAAVLEAEEALDAFMQKIRDGSSSSATALTTRQAAVTVARIAQEAAGSRAAAADRVFRLTVADECSRTIDENPLLNGAAAAELRDELRKALSGVVTHASRHFENRNDALRAATASAREADLPRVTTSQWSGGARLDQPLAPVHVVPGTGGDGLYILRTDATTRPVEVADATTKVIQSVLAELGIQLVSKKELDQ